MNEVNLARFVIQNLYRFNIGSAAKDLEFCIPTMRFLRSRLPAGRQGITKKGVYIFYKILIYRYLTSNFNGSVRKIFIYKLYLQ